MTRDGGLAAVDELFECARAAQARFERDASQERYDQAARAAAWAIMEPARNRHLAELAVRTTGLGHVDDKITKNHRKTLGLMRDLAGVRTCGVVRDDPATGITEIARPIGVIGAVVPSTNPAATPANNMINALKGGNAIILSPSPKGVPTCETLIRFVHDEFAKIGLDPDLVAMLPPPGSKAYTQRLMERADLVIVTGSQDNVRRAYASGTPAIGVGAGNVAVIVDETCDPGEAAARIAASKTFDNATSCSSENAAVVVDAVYQSFRDALEAQGCAILAADREAEIVRRMWPDGRLDPGITAQSAPRLLDRLGLAGAVPARTRFVAIETAGIGPGHPLSGEKLSLVLALYRARDFEDAMEKAARLLAHQGAGHSVGLHSHDPDRPLLLGSRLRTCRVIVNQAHCFATGGAFDNGMPFSLSMGCGSWGGNSIDDNLHWRHFIQTTRIVRTIPPVEPRLEDIFKDYWAVAGK